MKLIAESGSTKTEWRLIGNNFSKAYSGQGINPLFLKEELIVKEIEKLNLGEYLDEINEVHFYAAGLAMEELKEAVHVLLTKRFKSHTKIFVNDDLLAASRALFQNGSGISCILGTGSNSCLYKDGIIKDKIPALGFILGDEGSGSDIGKRFINSLLKKDIEEKLRKKILSKHQLSLNDVILNVYKRPLPNKYLASLSNIVYEYIDSKDIRELVSLAFKSFVDKNISKYSQYKNYEIAFVGSIAYYYREVLKKVLKEVDIVPSKILKQPIEELVEYHIKY